MTGEDLVVRSEVGGGGSQTTKQVQLIHARPKAGMTWRVEAADELYHLVRTDLGIRYNRS